MRALLFLILGTLVFGLAFPAFILIVGFFLLIFVALAIYSMITGAFGGRHVIIYKNGRRVDPSAGRRNDRQTADNPEVIDGGSRCVSDDVYDFGEEAEGEIVELPASALSKEDDDTTE